MNVPLIDFDGVPVCSSVSSTQGRRPAALCWRYVPSSDATSSAFLQMSDRVEAWVFEAAKKLDAVSRLRRGWDSHDGLALDNTARLLTIKVLWWLSAKGMPVPAVVLGSKGSVHLEWRGRGKELDLGIGECPGIEYVTVRSDGEPEEGRTEQSGEIRDLANWFLAEK